ncbi:DNA-binding FadR family transcriptional regulator [Sphingomonas jinjuensis]|uniref:DNA-binding FadR family transcriptional regulator n=1 Tax=Sphingomonas jinjuensis TaxID=535907 RepID=A0A840F1I8_9SPHN|nr:FadR/GntR family transcriptional regulator [Sphingomonas jinjuensis]MBB4153203.1 DNA-binding FadR family transcriptional regulator [Sphingomonas jinjuensis]
MSIADVESRPAVDGGRTMNLTKRIVQDLGQAIVTEQFTEATGFPFEAQLCEQYGASRSVVREAVKMLTAKGLLRARQRAGTIVQPQSKWSLLDPDVLKWLLEREFSIDLLIEFTEMRMAIEPRAAGLAAESATGRQRAAIVTAIERMFAAERGEDDPLEADIVFHRAVIEASNNRFMQQFTELSEATLRFSIRRTNAYAGVSRASAIDHRNVANAIVEGQPADASRLMHDLIQGALNLLLEAGRHATRSTF